MQEQSATPCLSAREVGGKKKSMSMSISETLADPRSAWCWRDPILACLSRRIKNDVAGCISSRGQSRIKELVRMSLQNRRLQPAVIVRHMLTPLELTRKDH